MGVGTQLELRSSQRLALTPGLRRSLEILALPAFELEQTVLRIAGENPFLEIESWPEEPAGAFGGTEAGTRRSKSGLDAMAPIQDVPAPWPGSLYEYLNWQLGLEALPEPVLLHARILIDALDPRGFLTEDIEQIAARAGVQPTRLADALEVIRRLDPPGIGARDARECLLLQLRRLREDGGVRHAWSAINLAERILTDCSDDLMEPRLSLKRLARKLRVSLDELGVALDLLRTLRPFPAAGVVSEPVVAVQPDLIVWRTVEGSLGVSVNSNALPRVRCRRDYARKVMGGLTDPRERQAVLKWLAEAHWVEQGLIRRNITLQRLGETLLALQPEFFKVGPECLRPMRLEDIATRLNVHKSTVSRAVRGKYIETPHGSYPLASLFSRRLDSRGQESVISARVVKERIRALIAAEDPTRPYSDEKLRELLALEGVLLSRRTVSKYRAALGIPPHHRRLGNRAVNRYHE